MAKKNKTNIFQRFAEGFKTGLKAGRGAIASALSKVGKMLQKASDSWGIDEEEEENLRVYTQIKEEEPGKVTEEFEFAVPEESPLEEAIRDLSEEGYAYVLNPEATYDTAEESFKQTMQAAYGQFGSEIFNQLYHTDMEMYGFDNKVIDAAIVETYEKYAGKECPPFADILAEIEDVIWNATTTIAKTSHLTR